jgi:hypothetical protein
MTKTKTDTKICTPTTFRIVGYVDNRLKAFTYTHKDSNYQDACNAADALMGQHGWSSADVKAGSILPTGRRSWRLVKRVHSEPDTKEKQPMTEALISIPEKPIAMAKTNTDNEIIVEVRRFVDSIYRVTVVNPDYTVAEVAKLIQNSFAEFGDKTGTLITSGCHTVVAEYDCTAQYDEEQQVRRVHNKNTEFHS